MTALDTLRSGDLGATLEAVQADVRRAPNEAKHRVFLFQLLCVLGEWTKAVAQLRLAAQLDPVATPMAQTYREAIGCELVRERVFRGESQPLVFGEPQPWIARLVQALEAVGRGEPAAAEGLRAEAFEAAPATAGTVNGTPITWIADADMRLGPVLEAIVQGKYYWAPFNAIRQIAIEEPQDLRDRVWTPAEVTWASGGQTPVLIPTRYPFAGQLEDDALKLAKGTRWQELPGGLFAGQGQRVLATDADDYGLMDIRQVALETEVPAPVDAAAEAGDV